MRRVFELADRIHIQRLARRIAIIGHQEYSKSDAAAIMTGAKEIKAPQTMIKPVYFAVRALKKK